MGIIPHEDLIEKYAVPGPRYTSYPTAVQFSDNHDGVWWAERLKNDVATDSGRRDRSYSLYFHIPFCPQLCLFCACHREITTNRSRISSYLDAISKELDTYRNFVGGGVSIEQIHLGGGSPNILDSDDMTRLWKAIISAFPQIHDKADISIELDPRATTAAQIKLLKSLGFNRVSFGVQDFDPKVQQTINRSQSFDSTLRLVELCRKLGFGSVGFDLIYGLPKQTPESFSETIKRVSAILPDRIALYGYAHVTWRSKSQKSLTNKGLPTSKERIRLFHGAVMQLMSEGYEHIGMDHFALPHDALARGVQNGALNRNFMGYSTHAGARVLGFGASSISSIPDAFAQNEKDIDRYIQLVFAQGVATTRGLSRSIEDQARGKIIEDLLCKGRVNLVQAPSITAKMINSILATSCDRLEPLINDGLIHLSRGDILLTALGRFFMRNVAMVFDEYLPSSDAPQVYSQTV